jgi:hypothetical protein
MFQFALGRRLLHLRFGLLLCFGCGLPFLAF